MQILNAPITPSHARIYSPANRTHINCYMGNIFYVILSILVINFKGYIDKAWHLTSNFEFSYRCKRKCKYKYKCKCKYKCICKFKYKCKCKQSMEVVLMPNGKCMVILIIARPYVYLITYISAKSAICFIKDVKMCTVLEFWNSLLGKRLKIYLKHFYCSIPKAVWWSLHICCFQ